MDITVLIFLLVYLAMGCGTLPGFKVDRTGAAIIGSLAMLVAGSLTAQAAWNAIDYKTLGMLFGLMVVSAGFSVAGFYGWVAKRVTELPLSPPLLVGVMIIVGASFSAFLTKDVVAVAMTPLLVSVSLARGLNPVPFLLAFCFAVNTGSTATLIGSPQNMITAQQLGLSFNGFLKIAAIPALLSLPIVWGVIVFAYRGRWELKTQAAKGVDVSQAGKIDVQETVKTGLVALVVIGLFIFSDLPRELVAMGGAGILLISRKVSSHDMLKQVDGDLLLLIMGLFIVNAAIAATEIPQDLLNHLREAGLDLNDPLTLLFVGGVLSNLVGNNPAVMLLVPYLHSGAGADALGAALALGTGFSSNMIVFGSLAGIIVVEQAGDRGIKISFMEFARTGIIVMLLCMIVAASWIYVLTKF
ncbi:SLC13 family permease [Ochrobactrum sp. Marseille-Q0166]|uniref:SLC13 family permease n=1 Tax=Ochrobactrum sp. Marseille-Q0166 TaxID=2761105 RepID=UPI001654E730|nr:SLC13 family permease [Ochrobactrum sp. Marseille-Q0166]MBC8718584.1 transporter [Ochrobactrum sp. Marseille-Q0166]